MAEAMVLSRRETKGELRKKSLKRFLLILMSVLLFLALIELLVAMFLVPNLTIRHLQVESDFSISKSEVLSIAGIGRKEYYFSIRSEDIRERLSAYPLVKAARVEKIFPDTLKIVLSRRIPLALAFGREGQKSVPVALDEEGVVFQVGSGVTDWHLPVMSGLIFKPQMGLRLPERLAPVLTELHRIRKESPELFDLISELKVTATTELDFELTFYPVQQNIRINLGNRFQEDLLKYSFLVLDVLRKQGIAEKVKDLDFRTGDVVYRKVEEEE
ncbi:MAG TPA: FtsQ-type POTRA domain-containing protein [Spirochaetia bacterium]|nr:FtsQ-type POTRA domain-containing protein [Spirochaetia bacterium]